MKYALSQRPDAGLYVIWSVTEHVDASRRFFLATTCVDLKDLPGLRLWASAVLADGCRSCGDRQTWVPVTLTSRPIPSLHGSVQQLHLAAMLSVEDSLLCAPVKGTV